MNIVAEALLTLQDDHRHTVGIGFVEDLTHALHRLERRRVCGIQQILNVLSPTCSSGGTPIVTMTVIASHARMMSTENRWIVRAANGGVVLFRCSCGLQHAVGKGVHLVRYSFGFDFTVHHDAAANAVTIALRHDTAHADASVIANCNDHGRFAPVTCCGSALTSK